MSNTFFQGGPKNFAGVLRPLALPLVTGLGVVRQETWSYNAWIGKCSIHYT